MINWDDLQNEINNKTNYSVDWNNFADHPSSPVTFIFDKLGDFINELSGYESISEQRIAMLKESPELGIQKFSDGYELDVDRVLAIQQRQSKGLTIIDINPGLLPREEFPLNIDSDFIFDGTNFLPQPDGSITGLFRSVSIPIQGNFVMIEFIQEINTTANSPRALKTEPRAAVKYDVNELNPASLGYEYLADELSRSLVYLNFNTTREKPFKINRSGDSFNTWFSELTVSLSVGAPKIRVTIGTNSTKTDGKLADSINSRLHLAGSARLFSDIDTTLMPFSICESDNLGSFNPGFRSLAASVVPTSVSLPMLFNDRSRTIAGFKSLGYSLLFITEIFVNLKVESANSTNGYFRLSLFVEDSAGTRKRLLTTALNADVTAVAASVYRGRDNYYFRPSEPLRVVMPNESFLIVKIDFYASNNATYQYAFTINGYSLGDIEVAGSILSTTKFITDATFLSDLNRVGNISRV